MFPKVRPHLDAELRKYLVLRALKKDLKARRGKGGRSVDAAWKIARPILDAISHAHARG